MSTKHTPEPWLIGMSKNHEDKEHNGMFIFSDKNNPQPDGWWLMVCKVSDMENLNELDMANAKRIIDCVNAMAGKPNPEMWVKQADEMLDKVIAFDHQSIKLGDSKLDGLLRLAKERDMLRDALQHIENSEMRTTSAWRIANATLEKLKTLGI
jgi:hypothetical protein